MENIIIIDYGSQYTLLIARRLRELGIRSLRVAPSAAAPEDLAQTRGIVLSGGPASVTAKNAPQLPDWVMATQLPILGICYGMQLLLQASGGTVQSNTYREYGPEHINIEDPTAFPETAAPSCRVWMSHGDSVTTLGPDFVATARTSRGVIAAIRHKSKAWWGLQFHPEVVHTQHGLDILQHFVEQCHVAPDWTPPHILDETVTAIRKQVGTDKKVLVAVSGGVDSTVLAKILHHSLKPEQICCVLADTGLLRKDEVKEIRKNFRKLNIHLEVIDLSQRFFESLQNISEPEAKRKAIGSLFVDGFCDFARHKNFSFLGQGTLYPDVIESSHGSEGSAKIIKSHHNVGGLPDRLDFSLVEPFRLLFKDEVRELGRLLDIPEDILQRHPFPGPGLAIRIPGLIDPEKVAILQEADAIWCQELATKGHASNIWQAFAVLLPVKSVGVVGDNRQYGWTCVLRAVHASDGMTAEVSDLPHDFLCHVAGRIVREVSDIARVLYDITSKPPATIEWE